MRWVFVIVGIACAVIAVVIAINQVDFMHQGDKIKELQQKINNTDFFKPAPFSLKLAFAQLPYNTTTGKYVDDPNNPNNADNIIIKYCIDHADLVAAGQNVVQDLVTSGMVPSYYDGKTCQQINDEHNLNYQEYVFNKGLKESQDSLQTTFGIESDSDQIMKDIAKDLPDDVKKKLGID
jgi:hypothetical protein